LQRSRRGKSTPRPFEAIAETLAKKGRKGEWEYKGNRWKGLPVTITMASPLTEKRKNLNSEDRFTAGGIERWKSLGAPEWSWALLPKSWTIARVLLTGRLCNGLREGTLREKQNQ